MNNKILWSEGMFLRPHHFQQHDRYWHQLIRTILKEIGSENWGISSLCFNHEALRLGKLIINDCSGITPDGTIFNVPNTDPPPLPLLLTEGTSNAIVYLAISEIRTGCPEVCLEEDDFRYRYHNNSQEVNDAVASSKLVATVNVAQLSLQLLLETNDLRNYSCIPIAKINEVRTNKQIILDDTFIPTCINIRASSHLINFLNEIYSLIQYRSETLAYRLTDISQSAAAEIVDLALLQIFNRFTPLFAYIIEKKSTHPEELYSYLLQLFGEISTYTIDKRRPERIFTYQHNKLTETFHSLRDVLRKSLNSVLDQNAISIDLQQQEYGIWSGEIKDKELLQSSNFILAVYSDSRTDELRNTFSNQVKISAIENIHNLVTRSLPGIGLQPLAIAPRQIPYRNSFVYFSLDKNTEHWVALSQSAGIACHIGNNFPGIKLELWAVKG